MNFLILMHRFFEKHGQEMILDTFTEQHEIRAFIQVMRYKNKIYIDLPQGEIGRRDNGCFLYIGPPEHDFTDKIDATKIFFAGQKYRVRRAQRIYFGNRPLYIWAVLYRTIRDGEYENA